MHHSIKLSLACVLATLMVMTGLPALAQNAAPLPKLTGRVVDLAGMIDPSSEADLTARLEAHEKATGNQIAILTIESLRGEALEDYSLRVARGWALGQKDRNNGVLFLISKNDRKLRLEVGYGLEPELTDAMTSFIIRRTVTPFFKKGLFSGGIVAGTGQVIEILESDESGLKTWRDRTEKTESGGMPDWPVLLFMSLWAMIFFGGILSNILVRAFGRKIKPGHYRWLGMDAGPNAPRSKRRSRSGSGGSRRGGGWSGGGSSGGFSGGGGSFGGGGSSGGW